MQAGTPPDFGRPGCERLDSSSGESTAGQPEESQPEAAKSAEASKDASQRQAASLKGCTAKPPPTPCPRCQSPNTKFAYWNNYNSQQPRFFCKVRMGLAWLARCMAGPGAGSGPHGVCWCCGFTLIQCECPGPALVIYPWPKACRHFLLSVDHSRPQPRRRAGGSGIGTGCWLLRAGPRAEKFWPGIGVLPTRLLSGRHRCRPASATGPRAARCATCLWAPAGARTARVGERRRSRRACRAAPRARRACCRRPRCRSARPAPRSCRTPRCWACSGRRRAASPRRGRAPAAAPRRHWTRRRRAAAACARAWSPPRRRAPRAGRAAPTRAPRRALASGRAWRRSSSCSSRPRCRRPRWARRTRSCWAAAGAAAAPRTCRCGRTACMAARPAGRPRTPGAALRWPPPGRARACAP
jgi:hypothetical protein